MFNNRKSLEPELNEPNSGLTEFVRPLFGSQVFSSEG